jgi:hypothetical protein
MSELNALSIAQRASNLSSIAKRKQRTLLYSIANRQRPTKTAATLRKNSEKGIF